MAPPCRVSPCPAGGVGPWVGTRVTARPGSHESKYPCRSGSGCSSLAMRALNISCGDAGMILVLECRSSLRYVLNVTNCDDSQLEVCKSNVEHRLGRLELRPEAALRLHQNLSDASRDTRSDASPLCRGDSCEFRTTEADRRDHACASPHTRTYPSDCDSLRPGSESIRNHRRVRGHWLTRTQWSQVLLGVGENTRPESSGPARCLSK